MKVESKYKNPDKFVKVLRSRASRNLRWMNEADELTRKQWGRQVNVWAADVDDKIGANALVLGVFEPGDTVILVGTVTKVVKNKDKSSIVYFDRVETRRRNHD